MSRQFIGLLEVPRSIAGRFLRSTFLLFAFLSGGFCANAQVTGLSFRPVDAAYSLALDRVVMISATPNQLHIFNAASKTDQTVALSSAPLNISLSSDGTHAAVAYVDSVAYVDLQAAMVVQTFTNIAVGTGKAILGSGYIYIFPSGYGPILSINIASAQVTTGNSASAAGGVFDSSVNAVYSTQDGSSLNTLNRYDTSAGVVGKMTSPPASYWGVYSVCGPLSLSHNGSIIYTSCGSIFQASTDTTKDMNYLGALPITSIQSLSTGDSAKQLAVIPKIQQYPFLQLLSDTVVNIYDLSSFNYIGQFSTTRFVANSTSYAAHGRWVFYNSSSSAAIIITQADSSAALEQDFAVENVDLTQSNSCNATFADTTLQVIAAGSNQVTQIISGTDCVYSAVSNVPWITVTGGNYGSGSAALSYLVRPNLTAGARSGAITMGSATLTVNQDAPGPASALTPLSFKPVAADYDKALDKIVMVATAPNELHIYDPVTQADVVVPLSGAPLSVSVRPDGLFAVVGHSDHISVVDLKAASVAKTITISQAAGAILFAGNGYAYTFPGQGVNSSANSIEISTGKQTAIQNYYNTSAPRLDVSGNYIYVGTTYSVSKLNIGNGPATSVTTNYSNASGNIWLSEDGVRLLTSNANAFFTSASVSQDLLAAGSLSATSSISWAANSQIQHQTAVLTDPSYSSSGNTALQIYADNGLQLQSQTVMPGFSNAGASYVSHGRYLFWNSTASSLFALIEADSTSGLLSDYAVYTVGAPQSLPACTYSVSPSTLNVPSYAYSNWNFNVVSNCNWQTLVSDRTWLSSSIYGINTGNGKVPITAQTNTGAARSAYITIGNQTVTVTQAASTCTFAISATSQSFPQSGGAGTVNLTTGATCPWSVQSSAAWLTLTGNQSGTGPAVIQYSAPPNASGGYEYGSLNIAGNTFNVIVITAPGKLVVSPAQAAITAAVGTSAHTTVTVTNVGGSVVNLYNAFTSGPFACSYSAYGLAPGASALITITYTATSGQSTSGSLTIYSSVSTVSVPLLGLPLAASDGAYDDRYSAIVYTGAWNNNLAPGRFAGTQTYSNNALDSASFTFTGTQVAYVYEAQANMGHVQVRIDDSIVTADLDEYSPALKSQQRMIYAGLSEGIHTITVSVLGNRNPSSSNSYAIIDAFLVGSRVEAFDDRDPLVAYTGAWGQNLDEGRYDGTQSFSNHPQDSASFTFTGTQVAYVYEAQSNMGHAQVSIDGVIVTADLDEYSPVLAAQKRVVYSGLSAGPHTITVTVLGTQDGASTNSYVIVDAFLLGSPGGGTYDDGDPDIAYVGGWQSNSDTGRYLGTQTFSNTGGDSASFTFSGTQVSYVYDAQSNLGHAQVSIDGVVVTQDLDEYSATLKPQQQVTYGGLTGGQHTIQVSVLGTKDAASSGAYVIVDAFVVAPLGPGVYDDAGPAVSFTGSWGHNTEYTRYDSTQSYSYVTGDSASFTFTGTQVAYVYATQSNLGHVKVSIDGNVVTADLDEYSAAEVAQLRMLYTGLSNGAHTITVTVLGTKDASSSAAYAIVDAFIAGPGAITYDDSDAGVSYSGAWASNIDIGRYQGTQTFSNTTGSQVSFSFTGTQVAYVYDSQSNMGRATVAIDGTVVDASVDEYSATLLTQQQRVYSGLMTGSHTITVTVQGSKNAAATDSYVIVDAFIVTP